MSESILQLCDEAAARCHSPDKPDPRCTHPAAEHAWRERLIREAAYFRSQHRGGGPGGELADWLGAEQEIDRLLAS